MTITIEAARAVRGSTTPRVFTAPLVTGPPGPCGCGCALTRDTSLGFAVVDFVDLLGMRLDPWQRWLFIHALELVEPEPDRDPRLGPPFRYRTIVILVARQNGKTTWAEIKNLWKLLVLDVRLVVSMAQDLATVEKSLTRAHELLKRDPADTVAAGGSDHEDLRNEVRRFVKTNGKWALQLTSGAVWEVYAPTSGGARGSSADDINLDELREHRNFLAWAAVSKTMMARPSGQLYVTSNAGDDRSIVLNVLHASARGAAKDPSRDPTLGLFEWSVPDNTKCTCGRRDPDPLDPEDIPEPHGDACRLNDPHLAAMANPSMGYGRLTWQAVKSALNVDPVSVFLTEVYCKRVPTLEPEWELLTEVEWNRQADREPGLRPANVAFCLQVSHDRKRTVIAAAGEHPRRPGQYLVAVIENREGTAWGPARLAQLRERWDPVAVALQDKGPTGAQEAEVRDLGIKPPVKRPGEPERPKRGDLINPWASDVADAYGQFVDGVRERTVWHLGEGPLTAAVAAAIERKLSGAHAWDDAKTPGGELLTAVTLALWAQRVRAPMVVSTYDPLANIG